MHDLNDIATLLERTAQAREETQDAITAQCGDIWDAVLSGADLPDRVFATLLNGAANDIDLDGHLAMAEARLVDDLTGGGGQDDEWDEDDDLFFE